MDIAFILPNIPRKPGGGTKVVFQYANYIAEHGNTVTIYYMTDRFLKGRIPNILRKVIGQLYSKLCPNWYRLNDKVNYKAAFTEKDISEQHNIIIATAVMTAFFVDSLHIKCKKYYFIQGFETFYTSEQAVLMSYKLSLKKIVISKWLQQIVKNATGESPICVQNGINLNIFKVKKRILDRSQHSIAFHYREATLKGCDYAIQAIDILREKYADLDVYVIGTVDCPKKLRKKCKYYKNITEAEVSEINNNVRIFMCTSIEEGFGLPGLEAMACGCALVSTDFAGSREYAIDGHNSLLSKVRNVKEMVLNIIKIFDNIDLLITLSNNAVDTAKRFDIDKNKKDFYDNINCLI